jgi:hypothetical protein
VTAPDITGDKRDRAFDAYVLKEARLRRTAALTVPGVVASQVQVPIPVQPNQYGVLCGEGGEDNDAEEDAAENSRQFSRSPPKSRQRSSKAGSPGAPRHGPNE